MELVQGEQERWKLRPNGRKKCCLEKKGKELYKREQGFKVDLLETKKRRQEAGYVCMETWNVKGKH